MSGRPPSIVGLGGTTRFGSITELASRHALRTHAATLNSAEPLFADGGRPTGRLR